MKATQIFNFILIAILAAALATGGWWIYRWRTENHILRQMVERLSADSRAAQVLVTKSEYDEVKKKIKTTVKFLEFDALGKELPAKYFTFEGNIIQFQSLVIRFEDRLVKAGDRLRGKSAYLFMKAFVLDGPRTQEFEITPVENIPEGYKIPGKASKLEMDLWSRFWTFALDPKARANAGIKNAQIEAPGSLFLPGTIYTLRIEHDGGLRIDTAPIPAVLKGESL